MSLLKNAVFWDVAPCRSYVNRRFGGTYRLHLQGRKIRERETSVSMWLHAASSLTDFSTLKMEAIRSSETSVHIRSTRHHIPEDDFFIVIAVKTTNLTQMSLLFSPKMAPTSRGDMNEISKRGAKRKGRSSILTSTPE
jgi:hypothetical protein